MLNEDRLDEVGSSLRRSIDDAFPRAGKPGDVEALDIPEEDANIVADFVASLRMLHRGLGAADASIEFFKGNRAGAAEILTQEGLSRHSVTIALALADRVTED